MNDWIDFWKELSEALYRTLFGYDVQRYTNLDLGWDGVQIAVLIAAILAGIALASIYTFVQKRCSWQLLNGIRQAEAYSAAEARTLAELKADNWYVRSALRRKNTVLYRLVRRVGAESADPVPVEEGASKQTEQTNDTPEEQAKPTRRKKAPVVLKVAVDYKTARFFIPQEEMKENGKYYNREGSGIKQLVLILAGIVIAFPVLCACMPYILSVADAVAGLLG